MLLLYIFIMVLMFSSVPYLVLMVKRGRTAAHMRQTFDRLGCEFHGKGIWYMGGIDGKRADFCVVFDEHVISVKVIGFLSAGTAVHFESATSYLTRNLKPSESDAPLQSYKKHKKKPYDFSAPIPSHLSGLPVAKVVLIMDPYPEKLTRPTPSGAKKLNIRESTGEGELYDVASFLKLFE
jgi:hypothetical protein